MIRKVEISNVDTSKLPVLSNEEKNALFLKIKEGDTVKFLEWEFEWEQ